MPVPLSISNRTGKMNTLGFREEVLPRGWQRSGLLVFHLADQTASAESVEVTVFGDRSRLLQHLKSEY